MNADAWGRAARLRGHSGCFVKPSYGFVVVPVLVPVVVSARVVVGVCDVVAAGTGFVPTRTTLGSAR